MKQRPLVLMILDGFGYSEHVEANAIQAATTPSFDALWQSFPHCLLDASGNAVGLAPHQMGNSEVGHLTLGAGRVLLQDYTRISKAIEDGNFACNTVFLDAIQSTLAQKKAFHVLGLLSKGGVHSHEDHLYALLELLDKQNAPVYLHLFSDGRDTPPKSILPSLQKLEAWCKTHHATIASLSGRYFAMDRDQRWERTEKVYRLLIEGKASHIATSSIEALTLAYQRNETDEFITPTLIQDSHTPMQPIQTGDTVFFMNYRSDRARQLSHALVDFTFNGFVRPHPLVIPHLVTLTQYEDTLNAKVAFPLQSVSHTLGAVLAEHGLKQLRLAETEKYAHVTFFFNGGQETPFLGEERVLIPSPKVATYENTPAMSAPLLTDHLVQAIESDRYDVIICNYANADMVGHTGNFSSTVQAIETLDTCLDRVVKALAEKQGELVITADHGNAECMFDHKNQQLHTAHTTSLVPCLYMGRRAKMKQEGTLADIAPTLLYLLGLPVPSEMTGASLIQFC